MLDKNELEYVKKGVKQRTLRLLQHVHILHVLVRHTLHEVIHLELIDQPRFLLLAASRDQVSSISV